MTPGGTEVRRIRDAYLEPWRGLATQKELLQEFATASMLAPLFRALEVERLIVRLEPAAHKRWQRKAEKWRRDFTQLQTWGEDKY
jgi:hypothetical protein